MNRHIFFLLTGLIIILWYRETRYRERAHTKAKRICLEHDIQLLDQTVSRSGTRLRWNRHHPAILRMYKFDYSIDGDDRHTGYLCLSGGHLSWIQLNDTKIWYT
jgi:hypothetical protein